MIDEPVPRPGRAVLGRFALAAAAIAMLSGAAVATGLLLEVKDVVNALRLGGKIDVGSEITRAEAGEPRTLLLLGADRRYAQTTRGLSDTILLVRLNPDTEATTTMSIPRDLRVEIPGYGRQKINAAYAYGGPKLALKTVKGLLGIEINHIVNVHFRGFRQAVDRIGCVYVDVDRRYFNNNLAFAEIDIEPGYQKLCGQDALDYVRYRHTDSDLVRGARQQDFLRQAKDQVRTSELIGDRKALARIFGKSTQTDGNLRTVTQVLGLLKLGIFAAGKPVREVRFDVRTSGADLEASPEQIRRAVRQFLAGRSSKGPRGKLASTPAQRKATKRRKKQPLVVAGLVRAPDEGQAAAIAIAAKASFPVYYPTRRTRYALYPKSLEPRVYKIRDGEGVLRSAFRMVVNKGINGEFYGIQGTTWKDPPILADPTATIERGGRKLDLYVDGTRLRVVAWRTEKAVYWISNTLLRTLTNAQMIAIARSLKRIKG